MSVFDQDGKPALHPSPSAEPRPRPYADDHAQRRRLSLPTPSRKRQHARWLAAGEIGENGEWQIGDGDAPRSSPPVTETRKPLAGSESKHDGSSRKGQRRLIVEHLVGPSFYLWAVSWAFLACLFFFLCPLTFHLSKALYPLRMRYACVCVRVSVRCPYILIQTCIPIKKIYNA